MSRPTRVLAVASAGGHFVQLLRLRPAWKGFDVTYVTSDPGLQSVVNEIAANGGDPEPGFAVVTEANRWQKMRLVKQLLQLFMVVARVRPDAVITTGAAPGYFALRVGKLFGARTVWVDSMANGEELSLSGQKAGKQADLWLTQWEHLSRPEGPKYLGSVL